MLKPQRKAEKWQEPKERLSHFQNPHKKWNTVAVSKNGLPKMESPKYGNKRPKPAVGPDSTSSHSPFDSIFFEKGQRSLWPGLPIFPSLVLSITFSATMQSARFFWCPLVICFFRGNHSGAVHLVTSSEDHLLLRALLVLGPLCSGHLRGRLVAPGARFARLVEQWAVSRLRQRVDVQKRHWFTIVCV